jgi:hypothetical protein
MTAAPLEGVTAATVERVAQRALGDDRWRVESWTALPLGGGVGYVTGTLARVEGTAECDGERRAWSAIVKTLRHRPEAVDPSRWNYWKREALFYGSDLPNRLPDGVSAPRCYAIEQRGDSEVSIWLEDLGDPEETIWTMDDYALAARRLGRMNGAWLIGRSATAHSWLNRRPLAAERVGNIADLERWPEAAAHPDIGPHIDRHVATAAIALAHRQSDLRAALDTLPQSVQHLDAARMNLMLRARPVRGPELVVFDWAFVGVRALGEELNSFVSTTSLMFRIDHAHIDELSDIAFSSYVQGLHDLGWSGDPDVVRLGYLGATTLHFPLLPFEVHMLNPHLRERFCGASGRPIGETIKRLMDVRRWGLQQEEEARRLMDRVVTSA